MHTSRLHPWAMTAALGVALAVLPLPGTVRRDVTAKLGRPIHCWYLSARTSLCQKDKLLVEHRDPLTL